METFRPATSYTKIIKELIHKLKRRNVFGNTEQHRMLKLIGRKGTAAITAGTGTLSDQLEASRERTKHSHSTKGPYVSYSEQGSEKILLARMTEETLRKELLSPEQFEFPNKQSRRLIFADQGTSCKMNDPDENNRLGIVRSKTCI